MGKSAVSYGIGHIYWRNPNEKLPFLCSVLSSILLQLQEAYCQTSMIVFFTKIDFSKTVRRLLKVFSQKSNQEHSEDF